MRKRPARRSRKLGVATLVTLSLLSIGSKCRTPGDVKVYDLREEGLVREQDQEVIPLSEAFGEFGCSTWDDIRTMLEAIEACRDANP